jgi:hypothetical protein
MTMRLSFNERASAISKLIRAIPTYTTSPYPGWFGRAKEALHRSGVPHLH